MSRPCANRERYGMMLRILFFVVLVFVGTAVVLLVKRMIGK